MSYNLSIAEESAGGVVSSRPAWTTLRERKRGKGRSEERREGEEKKEGKGREDEKKQASEGKEGRESKGRKCALVRDVEWLGPPETQPHEGVWPQWSSLLLNSLVPRTQHG